METKQNQKKKKKLKKTNQKQKQRLNINTSIAQPQKNNNQNTTIDPITSNNTPIISNNTIDIIIQEADEKAQKFISNHNTDTQIFLSEIYDLNILNCTISGQNDMFILSNWIDCIISYKNLNPTPKSQFYNFSNKKTRFAIINNITINNNHQNGLLHLWTANDTTIFDKTNNFTDAEINNALISECK